MPRVPQVTAPAILEYPFKPRGNCRAVFTNTDPELLLSGPAGTGKSRACLEKIYAAALDNRGMRALIVRQVRASLSTTGLVTWEKLVIPAGGMRMFGTSSAEHRLEYKFPNGSVVTTGGMDKPDKIMSSEYDLIYVQEATELKEAGWEALSTRLRNGVLPYQQLLADCNPSAPSHWLKKRCDAKRTKILETRHEDNPRLWDVKRKKWTDFGRTYISKLDNLTGARKQRLRYGRWVQAEGVVYELWDTDKHLVEPFPIPVNWPRYLSIDFGFTNPFVCQWWARDPDGRFFMYREIYKTKTLVEDHAKRIKQLSAGEPTPAAVYTDHDAEDRETFRKHTGWATVGAIKTVTQGIQAVTNMLAIAGDGKPRLSIFKDALVEADADLVEAKRPTCTAEEFDAYIWAEPKDGHPVKEEPVKEFDHGLDALRYLVATHGTQQLTWAFG